jgi:hypothetical protein
VDELASLINRSGDHAGCPISESTALNRAGSALMK